MNEVCSARPVGGLSVGPRAEYQPGPQPFRRETGPVKQVAKAQDRKDTTKDKVSNLVAKNPEKTQVEMIFDAVKAGYQSLNAIQRYTGFDRKKIRDITNKQLRAGNLVTVDRSITAEKVFALPDQKEKDILESSSQASAGVTSEAGDNRAFSENSGVIGDVAESLDATPTEKAAEVQIEEMEERESDLGYSQHRLEHLYKTAQSSLGAFWEAVVELKAMADDALLAKEKLFKVYDALGQIPVHLTQDHQGKGGHSKESQ